MDKLIANTFPARPKSGGEYNPDSLIGHWWFEPKYNGWRAFIDLADDRVLNRHGEPMSIGESFQQGIESIRYPALDNGIRYLDVEALERRHDVGRGSLILLDIPDSRFPYERRRKDLQKVAPVLHVDSPPKEGWAYCCPAYPKSMAGQIWMTMQLLNNAWRTPFYEGLVAKKQGSEYPVTHSASQTFHRWVKFRFADSHTKLSSHDYDQHQTQAGHRIDTLRRRPQTAIH